MAAGRHYTWFGNITTELGFGPEVGVGIEKIGLGVLLGMVLIFLAKQTTARLRAEGPGNFIVPNEKLTVFSFFDFFVDGFTKFHDSVLGRENRKYLPLCGTVFLFIFCANLLGLVPGFAAITTTVWVNVAIALVVFVYFNYLGVREHGALNYIKHFGGPVWWAAWFVLPLELFSTGLRIITLNLRLYWNMSADHMVLFTFLDIAPIPVPVIFYFFGTFVSFMQAFVFTILTMIYILLATQHEDEH